MLTAIVVLLVLAAVLAIYAGSTITARSEPAPVTVEVEYLDTFTLTEPYVKYINGRKARKRFS